MSGSYFLFPQPGCITEEQPRFFGVVQAGYRSLLARVVKVPEPTSNDVQGPESEGEAERSPTSRTFSRISSFNKSFNAGTGDGSENESPYLNQFTTVGLNYGKSLASPTSPTKSGVDGDDIVVHPPLLAPTSPTRAKHELNVPVKASIHRNNSPGGNTGGSDTSTALVAGTSSPTRGSRSSKRLREGREGAGKTMKPPERESGVSEATSSTRNKRKKV